MKLWTLAVQHWTRQQDFILERWGKNNDQGKKETNFGTSSLQVFPFHFSWIKNCYVRRGWLKSRTQTFFGQTMVHSRIQQFSCTVGSGYEIRRTYYGEDLNISFFLWSAKENLNREILIPWLQPKFYPTIWFCSFFKSMNFLIVVSCFYLTLISEMHYGSRLFLAKHLLSV